MSSCFDEYCTLWHHDPKDTNWTLDSYNKLYQIKNVDDFWCIYNSLNTECLKYNMLFLMKNDIKPLWEDESNKYGGTVSLKVFYKDIYNSWMELSMALLGNYICKDESENKLINGISISPKNGFCIIKIWLNKPQKLKLEYTDIKPINYDKAIYKNY